MTFRRDRGRREGACAAAALLALILLAFAGVKSTVMQALAPAAAAAVCDSMPGMAPGVGTAKGKPALCAYCDVAGQPPLAASGPPALTPPMAVARSPEPAEPARPVAEASPVPPRARGPPAALDL